MAIVKCDNCKDGYIDDDRWIAMRLAKKDEDGGPVFNRAGDQQYTYVRIPYHVQPYTKFDPTGLVPAACSHGLLLHPDPERQADRAVGKLARSWIKSRHIDMRAKCPVCRGEPRPDDLTAGYENPTVG